MRSKQLEMRQENGLTTKKSQKQLSATILKPFYPPITKTFSSTTQTLFSKTYVNCRTIKKLASKPLSRRNKRAVFGSKPLKSPGPDVIPPAFFQTNWDKVKSNVIKSTHSFFNSKHLLKEQIRTFIALIPKTDRPESVNDFRPITLCNSSYKIISKILVNRLKPILGSIVSEFQNAFVPGRQMVDNCLVAHEVINWVKKRKKGTLYAGILKVDLSKAYHRIRWDFLEAILTSM